MRNLWADLPANPPYVHPQDDDILYRLFNRLEPAKRPHTDLVPSPYLGNPRDAKVLILTKYPTYEPRTAEFYDDLPEFLEASRKNLTFENHEHPFYPIDPRFASTPAYQWWRPRLAKLIEDCGLEHVSANVASVAYFPYYMSHFNPSKDLLPSQRYTFELVRTARDTGKKIVALTYGAEWNKQIARLDFIKLKGQNMTILPTSVADGRYDELVEAILDGAPRPDATAASAEEEGEERIPAAV